MWNNPDELVIGGTGEVYVAPTGTALPTDPTAALASAFVGLGLLTEDGVTLTVNPDFQEITSWQAHQPVRREFIRQNIALTFKLQQWNENTIPLAFGGGAVTALGGGKYRYDLPPAGAPLDERALVVDIVDGVEHWRLVFARGNAQDAVATDFRRTAGSELPIGFGVLAPDTDPNGPPGYFLTDSAALTAGS